MSEVQELYNLSLAIHQRPEVNVIIDNKLETACTDFKNIFVTTQLVPPELRKFRRVVSRVLDGECAHEAGHLIITAGIKPKLTEWIERQPNPSLANIVHQSIEDKRVNHYILNRYRFDFAYRLQLLADVANRLWIDTLKLKVAEQRNKYAQNAMKPECVFLEEMMISIATIEGLWGIGVEKEFDMNEDQKDFVAKTKAIFEEASFDRMAMSIIGRHQQLYDLWEKRLRRTAEKGAENCPKNIGGELKLTGGMGAKKMLAKMEKKLKKQEQEAEEQDEKEAKRKKEIQEGMAAGAGSGLNIPTPIPDENAYETIVQRNREHIERLLNLLKKLAHPKLMVDKWRRQGRIMTEILTKAYVSSTRREVNNIYARKSMMMEKAEACIGLLVDLSGSVNEDDAKDSLAVISEVCGRWLRDEDFAIMVFGSDYQKIKAFVEPYHTTRVRIGGVRCLGGTELLAPLNEMYKMLKAQRNGRAKMLMIVSDFYVNKESECKKLLRQIEKDGINVIGLGIDNTKEDYIKTFVSKAKYIGSIKDLPETVFDLYKTVAL